MDLINEYYVNRRHTAEYNEKIETKHKKIIEWQKKFKIKATPSIPLLSSKKLMRLKNKMKESPSKQTISKRKSVIDMAITEKQQKKYLYKLVLSLNEFKERLDPSQKNMLLGPIEKFSTFEKKIRKCFRQSYAENFPDSTDVLEDVLNLMFETADNSFTKTVKVNIHQIAVVPDSTAKYMNAKNSLSDRIQVLINNDLEISKQYKAMPKSVFGKTLLNSFKIDDKENDFKLRWNNYSQRHDYHRDLETFAAVWKNITHLQTTRKFCAWLANNPHIAPPAFLKDEGLLKEETSDFSALSFSLFDDYTSSTNIVDRSFSKSRHMTIDVSGIDSIESSASLGSVDISDINIIV